MIQFADVSKIYTGLHNALDHINLDIAERSFVFLIGPSGAGKTTLLRLIIRDALPTSGTIIVDGWKVNTLPRSQVHHLRRKVGMIFQDFKILNDRTVYENVALGLEILGKKQSEIQKRVNDALELVGLGSRADHFPLQLSAGEMQRTSIARAIIGGPKILLADEPTGNLDPFTAWKILHILDEINSMGTTIIMATHNSDIVNHFKKRTITMEGGKIVHDEEKGKYHIDHGKKSK